MCLFNDVYAVGCMLSSRRKTFVGYKVVLVDKSRLTSAFYSHVWTPGWHVSNSKRNKVCMKDSETISRGIHVYTKMSSAQRDLLTLYRYEQSVILKVVCNKEDLLGADINSAVFKRVYLSKKTYAEAISQQKV